MTPKELKAAFEMAMASPSDSTIARFVSDHYEEFVRALSALEGMKGVKGALVEIVERLNCRGDDAHYCPNCDNSLWNTRAVAMSALSQLEAAGI